jgi:haloalkane dehalogenase
MPYPAPNLIEPWRPLYPFASHWLEVEPGVRLHYLDEGQGSGATLVMLHGNPTWSFYFRNLVCGLRNTHRVLAPDHVGCGLSDKPAVYPYVLERHIENVERLLAETLRGAPVVLVVHDWGGAIGMGYAVRHPEQVAGLVVLNTAAFLLTECPWRIRVCKLPGFGALAIRGLNAFAGAAIRMAVRHHDRMTPEVRAGFLAPYSSWADRIANLRFVQDIPLFPAHPTWQTVQDIQDRLPTLKDKPMLICWGDRDFCFTPRFFHRWLEYFPNAEAHRFADAGHYVLEDAHERVLPLVRDFLGRVPPIAATA